MSSHHLHRSRIIASLRQCITTLSINVWQMRERTISQLKWSSSTSCSPAPPPVAPTNPSPPLLSHPPILTEGGGGAVSLPPLAHSLLALPATTAGLTTTPGHLSLLSPLGMVTPGKPKTLTIPAMESMPPPPAVSPPTTRAARPANMQCSTHPTAQVSMHLHIACGSRACAKYIVLSMHIVSE